ncbi:MAG TPA: hypothetical protein VNE16_07655 [Vicinamibacterales bacterium]|nr:hypothetical protein [Vicinamibacterales bacterium]
MTGMSEEALRALVRDVVARGAAQAGGAGGSLDTTVTTVAAVLVHASHQRFTALPRPGDACLIEPAVPCTHCGYCQSYGH